MVSTGDPSYGLVVRPKITIKTLDGVDTLYTFNAFSPTDPINVTYLDVEGAIGEAGTFNIEIEDSANVIDKGDLHGVKVYTQLGKSEATLQYFMIGFADVFAVNRPATRYQTYKMTGFGTAIQAGQLMIHRRETYKKGESDAKIYNIVNNA